MTKSRLPVSAILTRIAIAVIGVALFLDQAGARRFLHLGGDGGPDPMTPAAWVGLLAPAFFLWALWAASSVLVRMRCGEAFGPVMVRGLNEIGAGLMLGAFCAVVVQPTIINLIGNGFREVRGVAFAYTVENVMLGLVGLTLVLLAREGRGLKSELDQIV
ncbi:MAG TPA: DUF2975 domain-containing protein [Caulobacteraceae bacterium]|jgi:hypothetical protein